MLGTTGRVILAVILVAAALGGGGCTGDAKQAPAPDRPNVLWVVWDTVRADRLSLYGHDRPTTPFLESWAKGARVYDNCISTAGSTVPSHASMFTGLLPTEHGAYHGQRRLNDAHDTIAERMQAGGYRTYLYAANPHIQEKMNFHQGFDVHEHPWSDKYREQALSIVRKKVAEEDRTTTLPGKVRSGKINDWDIKAAGELAQRALVDWLDASDESRPWFAFLNYMEAHTPYIPPRVLRERVMTPEQVTRSYEIDSRSTTRWAYTFGRAEYPDGDLDVVGATYDATLIELDQLFRNLIEDLETRGLLDNTVVILTADHGEHLGEHHMLDHQYALYQPLIGVPLVVHYPKRFAPGRDESPVVTFDLYPTLLELAGLEIPTSPASKAISLLGDADPRRTRLAEYPAVFEVGIRQVRAIDGEFDAKPWMRRMRALYREDRKLICATDGRHELYDLSSDPGETRDRHGEDPTAAASLMSDLVSIADSLTIAGAGDDTENLSELERKMLEELGYLAPDGESDGSPAPDAEALDSLSGYCGF